MPERIPVGRFSKGRLGCEKRKHPEVFEFARPEIIIVPGAEFKILPNGEQSLGPRTEARLMAALELLKHGLVDRIMVAGGMFQKKQKEPIAETMRKFLASQGVSNEKIECEAGSINTEENLRYALKILESRKVKRILLETSEYHLGRAKLLLGRIAREFGYRAVYSEYDGLRIDGVYLTATSAEKMLNTSALGELKTNPRGLIIDTVKESLQRVLIYLNRDKKLAEFLSKRRRKGTAL